MKRTWTVIGVADVAKIQPSPDQRSAPGTSA